MQISWTKCLISSKIHLLRDHQIFLMIIGQMGSIFEINYFFQVHKLSRSGGWLTGGDKRTTRLRHAGRKTKHVTYLHYLIFSFTPKYKRIKQNIASSTQPHKNTSIPISTITLVHHHHHHLQQNSKPDKQNHLLPPPSLSPHHHLHHKNKIFFHSIQQLFSQHQNL